MGNTHHEGLCVYHVLDGLKEGLSKFAGPSRVALMYSLTPNGPLRVYDPQGLLSGHEYRLRTQFSVRGAWRSAGPDAARLGLFEEEPGDHLQFSGLISLAGWSRSIYYQRWFTEHHPDICSIGPYLRWLEHAAWLLAQDFSLGDVMFVGTSGFILQDFAKHAIRDYIVDRRSELLGWDTQLRIYPVLDDILGISKTPEEGDWPKGELIFVEPERLGELDFIARISGNDRPSITNHKRVRKLLQAVELSERKLVSDGKTLVGIAVGPVPESSIRAEFKEDFGFLWLDGELVASFIEGRFSASNHKASLVQLEEALLESRTDMYAGKVISHIVSRIVQRAREYRHGCTLVVDLNHPPLRIPGQPLERPLDIYDARSYALVKALAKLDGALHIGADFKLHGFACLLDGLSVPGENLARGARFNSALRFTAAHDNVIVVVVSADRTVSVIQSGVELTAQCEWHPVHQLHDIPPTFDHWLSGR